jgi:hypothetical protein
MGREIESRQGMGRWLKNPTKWTPGPLVAALDFVDGVDGVGVHGVEESRDGRVRLRVAQVEAGPTAARRALGPMLLL